MKEPEGEEFQTGKNPDRGYEAMSKSGLSLLRKRIDRIDKRLTGLLVKRYECISAIGLYKCENDISVADPEREAEVLSRATRGIRDEETLNFIREVYAGIFNASRAVEIREAG